MVSAWTYYTKGHAPDQEFIAIQSRVKATSGGSNGAVSQPSVGSYRPPKPRGNITTTGDFITSAHPATMGSNGLSDPFDLAIHQNKQWAQRTATDNPTLFPTLASGQHPQILWIGCSDSRIPETTVLNMQPGDVFVHRNIANVLPPTDINSQSVIAYAVAHLKVKHVVVCGHTSCGGINAALGNQKLGLIDAWLTPLRKLRMELSHARAWEGMDPRDRALALVEANVRQGVQTLRENAEVIAGTAERGLVVHGLVYDVASGELTELDCAEESDGTARKFRDEAFHTKAFGERDSLIPARHWRDPQMEMVSGATTAVK